MRLKGGRTGKRAVVCEGLELTGLMKPFDLEVWYGERVAVLGSNGSGKSHFLRLLAAGGSDPDVEHRPVGEVADRRRSTTPARPGSARGCGRAGSCRPTSTPSWSAARCWRSCTAATRTATGMPREQAARALDRYELAHAAEQKFESLSGGQQARFQILLLELSGATLLLLDEPTDNLDVRVGRGAGGGPGGVRGHGAGGHPRPLVRARLRPVPRVRRRRRRSTSPTARCGTRAGSSGPAEREPVRACLRGRRGGCAARGSAAGGLLDGAVGPRRRRAASISRAARRRRAAGRRAAAGRRRAGPRWRAGEVSCPTRSRRRPS